jgi:integrase
MLLRERRTKAKSVHSTSPENRLKILKLQRSGRHNYTLETPWPLSPASLQTADVLAFRHWLLSNRSQTTACTYAAAVMSFLHFLDSIDHAPDGVQLGKLAQQLKRRGREQNQAAAVVDKDEARQAIPAVVAYYDQLPLPPENDAYNQRLSLLRDRALVNVLYATAARLSEVLSLNRSQVNHGRAATATITGKGRHARSLHLMPLRPGRHSRLPGGANRRQPGALCGPRP